MSKKKKKTTKIINTMSLHDLVNSIGKMIIDLIPILLTIFLCLIFELDQNETIKRLFVVNGGLLWIGCIYMIAIIFDQKKEKENIKTLSITYVISCVILVIGYSLYLLILLNSIEQINIKMVYIEYAVWGFYIFMLVCSIFYIIFKYTVHRGR